MKDIVQLLLTFPSVDPRAKDNWALILAKENKHEEVYNLLVQRSPENDIETGLIDYSNSSYDILSDLIHAQPDVAWKEIRQLRDLQLLLDTSTKILPYLEYAISDAITMGKTELAIMMLFFIAFDHSYFNHIVLIRQLMRGNSFKDIRKINPFRYGNESLFVKAVTNGDAQLANLILDKALKLNPIQPLICMSFYLKRFRNLEIASNIIGRARYHSDIVFFKARLKRILYNQATYLIILGSFIILHFAKTL
jgi:hypothetical protein